MKKISWLRSLRWVVVPVLAVLTGCSQYRVAFAPEAAGKLGAVQGIVAVEREEIGTTINAANSAGATAQFGLIGALVGAVVDTAINSSAAKRVEEAVTEARDTLVEFPFEKEMLEAFTGQFEGSEKLKFKTLVVTKNMAQGELARLVSEAETDAVGVVFVRHFFSPDFLRVLLLSEVVVCAKSEELKKLAVEKKYGGEQVPVLYRNRIQTEYWLPSEARSEFGKNPSANALVAAWSANKGELLRKALVEGCRETAEMIHWDVGQPALEDDGNGRGVMVSMYENSRMDLMKMPACREVNGRVWARSKGRLYAVAAE